MAEWLLHIPWMTHLLLLASPLEELCLLQGGGMQASNPSEAAHVSARMAAC